MRARGSAPAIAFVLELLTKSSFAVFVISLKRSFANPGSER
jgi:hypothetical protein